MQILHFSDLHIGVENYGRPANESDLEKLPDYFAPGVDRKEYLGLSTRLLDFLTVFDYIIKFAIENQVDLVLLSGDAYKSRDPSQTHQREFARRIAHLTSESIPVFLLLGNHDIPHAIGRATALEIFSTLRIPLVCIGDQLQTYRIETKSGPLQIVALPWIRRGSLLVREEHQGRPITDITNFVESELTRRLENEAKNLDQSTPTILSAHVSVAGSTTSSERSMMLGRDYVLQRSSLALPAFDYVALGHIHKHQSLGESPPIVYPGSPQRVDFSEEKDNKGFCLVTIDPQKSLGHRTTWTFCPITARPFVTINCEISKSENTPTEAV
ncbi:exonuclease SbcCD subunit D, partial [SAR202 cluster bacterium AD-802-E10_MRT_200m]|nr:exonuclease SbcCD subunit D [SAR202 cluster bacterium AD-802-E10_MRT_200m]